MSSTTLRTGTFVLVRKDDMRLVGVLDDVVVRHDLADPVVVADHEPGPGTDGTPLPIVDDDADHRRGSAGE